jgi:3-hydroxybutyryl-CoA dehydrogenase
MVIRTIGIVGAGTMGAGIAQVALEAGHDVLIHDADIRVVGRARERIRDGLGRRAQRLGVEPTSTDAWVDERLARLRPAMTIQDVATSSDLVVEAVIEDLAIKRALFRDLDEAAPREAILATNTSALSVAAVVADTRRPDRVVGLHFFNPAPVMALVEVASRRRLTVEADRRPRSRGVGQDPGPLHRFLPTSTGSTGVHPGRPHHAGGATIERIDGLIRAAGFRDGPFELMDLVASTSTWPPPGDWAVHAVRVAV